jgi:Holliday junction resolvase-like predicted endonuclease
MHRGIRSDPAEWTDERQKRGLAGEEQAIRYLLSRGWSLVAHRFRVGRTEIDLIGWRSALWEFVKVKAG